METVEEQFIREFEESLPESSTVCELEEYLIILDGGW